MDLRKLGTTTAQSASPEASGPSPTGTRSNLLQAGGGQVLSNGIRRGCGGGVHHDENRVVTTGMVLLFLWRFNTGITRGMDLPLAPCTAPALATLSRVGLSTGHGDSGLTPSGRDLDEQPFQHRSLPHSSWSPGGLQSWQRKWSWRRLLGQKLMQCYTPQDLSAARQSRHCWRHHWSLVITRHGLLIRDIAPSGL